MSSPSSTIAVIGGDSFASERAIGQWTGTSVPLSSDGQRVPLSEGDLYVLPTERPQLENWPGGPLIWFIPHHGPSRFDLMELGHFLHDHSPFISTLFIVALLLPSTCPEEERDLANFVSETIPAVLPEDTVAMYRAISDREELSDFLSELKSQCCE